MDILLVLYLIFQSVSSVLCQSCSDVKHNKNGFSILVKRDIEGGHSYWVYDKSGNEWELSLKETNKQMDIDHYGTERQHYDRGLTNRFEGYCWILAFNLNHYYSCGVSEDELICDYNGEKEMYRTKMNFTSPLFFKIYPKLNVPENALYYAVYERSDKSKRMWLKIWDELRFYRYRGNIEFVTQMSDTLFSGIDSVADYNWAEDVSGWMLWFNIDGRYHYCFQPEGEPLSQQCSSKENLTLAFKHCYTDEDQSTTTEVTVDSNEDIWPKIALILVIAVIVIAIIAIIIYCLNRSYEKALTPRTNINTQHYKSIVSNRTDNNGSVTKSKSDIIPKINSTIVQKSFAEKEPQKKWIHIRGYQTFGTTKKASVSPEKNSQNNK